MSWQPILMAGGATYNAFMALLQERINHHTKTCLSRRASIDEVRAAQAAIEELEHLARVRSQLVESTKGV